MELADRYLNAAVMVGRRIVGKKLIETLGTLYTIAGQEQIWTDLDACKWLLREAENRGHTTSEALPLLEEMHGYLERGVCLEDEGERWYYGVRAGVERMQRQCRMWLAAAYEAESKFWQAGEVYQMMTRTMPGDEKVLKGIQTYKLPRLFSRETFIWISVKRGVNYRSIKKHIVSIKE